MDMDSALVALSALAHEGRLNAFRLLVQAGVEGLAAGEIARSLEVPPNTLSSNLSILANAGLVERRRDGRSIVYRARYDAMTGLLEHLMQDCCGGSPEICAPLADVARRSACSTDEAA